MYVGVYVCMNVGGGVGVWVCMYVCIMMLYFLFLR